MSGIVIGATTDDIDGLLQLLRDCELTAAGLLDHLGTTLYTREGDRIVASAALEVYPDGALLRSVAVAPDRRGAGLARDLVTAAIVLARSRDVPALYLLTLTAERYFPRFGFERIERAQVPPGVQQSVEFTAACSPCASATVMRKRL